MRPSDITDAREALGLTQEEVAARARVSEQTVSRIERGIRVRPNSLKDVYAVLGLAYEPLDTIELVMSDRLMADPITDILRLSCASLPDIRYLVRSDRFDYAEYLRNRFYNHPLRACWENILETLAVVSGAIFIPFLTLMLCFAPAHDNISATLDWTITLFLMVMMWLIFGLPYAFVIYTIRDNYFPKNEYPVGYAVSEDTIWNIVVRDDDVSLTRISLAEANRYWIARTGPFIEINVLEGEHLSTLSELPAHDGVIALIKRPRASDRTRTIPLPQIQPAAAQRFA